MCPPGPFVDIGCGEGWLARAIAAQGREVLGVDASLPLIEAARRAAVSSGARFEQASYVELADRRQALGGPFAVAVCNFALLDDQLTNALTSIRSVLVPRGVLLIQTVHPFTACGSGAYRNGWREETFDAFGGRFPSPMPWYFRTVASWIEDVRRAGYVLESLSEPMATDGVMPLSLLIRAQRSD
jgi:2-polyprenyl-3-methyl-5-hydroxy-6-metoxy-1,4-benzoquinol methylase